MVEGKTADFNITSSQGGAEIRAICADLFHRLVAPGALGMDPIMHDDLFPPLFHLLVSDGLDL